MKNVFFCSTQYQLFNAINIANSSFKDDENVAAIIGCIPGIKDKMISIAEKSRMFSEVRFVEAGRSDGSVSGYLSSLISYLLPATLGIGKIKTDRVFIVATEIYSRICAYELLRKNKKAELYYYEEGIGSYAVIISQHICNSSNLRLKLRFRYYLIDRCKGLYVYQPKYVIDNPRHIPLFSIPSVNVGSEWANFLGALFISDTEESEFSERILYFGTYLPSSEEKKELDTILNTIHHTAGKNLIIKPHPSEANEYKQYGYRIFETKVSFEFYHLRHSFADKMLISLSSTACIIPKLVFNEEPCVVLTYNAVSKKTDTAYDAVFKRIKEDYFRTNRFIIADSISEINEAIEGFLKNKGETHE